LKLGIPMAGKSLGVRFNVFRANVQTKMANVFREKSK
jgi:hypothetical protein